jgi:ferrous iron transport protein A
MMSGSTLWMVANVTSLIHLEIGAAAVVERLDLPDEVQHHLMHMGFVPEARVVAVRRAPAGDPTVYAIDGFEIALRRETARSIWVSVVEAQVGVGAHTEVRSLAPRATSWLRRLSLLGASR